MGSKSAETPLIVIVGETASGKTAAAIKVARKAGGEVICADSRTVYKQMSIGTAKPSVRQQKLVPHHLLDIKEPNEYFSAAEFKDLAEKCIQEIHARRKIPIIVGGTGLYIDSVLYNFQFNSRADPKQRAELEQMSDEQLTTLLQTKNIDTAILNIKNRRHVIRAIERNGAAPINQILRKNTIILGLTLNREVLKQRVTARVEQMFALGLLDEADMLVKKYGKEAEALKTPGYNAAVRCVEGTIDETRAKAEFVQADLHLAKRQRTWFKRNKSIIWFEAEEPLIAKAVEFARRFDYNKNNV